MKARATTVRLLAVLALSACGRAPKPTLAPPPQAAVLAASALEQLQHDVNALIASPPLQRATWGILVKSLARGDTLCSLNAGKLLMPASNMKIATLAAAAERLGWDFTYETRLVSTGAIHDGVLEGDLVVVGSGDPSIDDWDGAATRLFHEWAERLNALGVHEIAGRIVGDDRAFADEPYGIGWEWDDLDNSYATGVGALQFNENTARLVVTPAAASGEAARVALQQTGSGLVLRNAVTTTSPGTPVSVTTRRLVGSPLLDVRGSLPVGGRPVVINVSVVNPTVYFATALRDALVASNINVRGDPIDIDELGFPPRIEGPPLLAYRSARLADLAVTMMKNSQNLYAETLLRSLGDRPATFEGARAAAQSILQRWDVGSAELIMADGSGLSRHDLVTPGALVSILSHVDRDERLREPFERALPVAGVDGTLAEHMKGTAAERNVRAKTGSLSNARALSGYVSSADGEPLVFSIIANHYGASSDVVEKTEDAIAVRLAQFSRR